MTAKRIFTSYSLVAVLFTLFGMSNALWAESVLEKIEKSGKVNIGYREGAVPFGYMNDKGEWVGFDMDLGTELVKALEAKFNKRIEHTRTPMNPKNRIPLVANGTIDAGIGATTITLEREGAIDFSLPYFLTGTKLLVAKGSPIRDYRGLAGKKVGVGSGSTANIKGLQKAIDSKMIDPPCEMVLFEDHTKGFLGLQQGKVDAYFTDEAMLAGMRAKAPKPDDYEIVGGFLTYEPYGIILPPGDSKWRDFVNATLIGMFKDGTFEKTYNKWFGPGGQLILPMPEEYRVMLKVLSFPD
ncbi:MAG: ABC transporter substrate-binding protein [Deltaproteobacteria bacterium]|nr:ABC transporter substrate-binding protein [Deltaproteobacteria bacterium]